MPLPTIQSLWIGDTLSTIEQLCIRSFLENGHEFNLYSYQNIEGIPEGTNLKDANTIIPEEEVFVSKKGSYALFSDWFRWKLLYEKGGFWVDMDVICLKPFNFDSQIIYGSEGSRVCNAVIGFPKSHALCKLLMEVCEQPNRILPYDTVKIKVKKLFRRCFANRRNNISWGEAGGPKGFTRALHGLGLYEQSKPVSYFYPIDCLSWNKIFDADSVDDEILADSYAIHLWNEMSRQQSSFDKNATFAATSLIERLKSRYVS